MYARRRQLKCQLLENRFSTGLVGDMMSRTKAWNHKLSAFINANRRCAAWASKWKRWYTLHKDNSSQMHAPENGLHQKAHSLCPNLHNMKTQPRQTDNTAVRNVSTPYASHTNEKQALPILVHTTLLYQNSDISFSFSFFLSLSLSFSFSLLCILSHTFLYSPRLSLTLSLNNPFPLFLPLSLSLFLFSL